MILFVYLLLQLRLVPNMFFLQNEWNHADDANLPYRTTIWSIFLSLHSYKYHNWNFLLIVTIVAKVCCSVFTCWRTFICCFPKKNLNKNIFGVLGWKFMEKIEILQKYAKKCSKMLKYAKFAKNTQNMQNMLFQIRLIRQEILRFV